MIKQLIKQFIPPIVFTLKNSFRKQKPIELMWSGNYPSWKAAQEKCTGYDAENILELCKQSLLKVKNGAAVYERDSAVFDKIEYGWGLLAGLLKVALANHGHLSIVDFGGSLGSSYYQNKGFLSDVQSLRWSIIEQPHFVTCGRENFEDDHLKFYPDMQTCLAVETPNVLVLSSVLQYLEKPYEWLSTLLSYNFDYIIIDRTAFINTAQRITFQNVPDWIYKASYPAWFFNESELLSSFNDYEIIADFGSFAEPTIQSEDSYEMYWKGFILKRIG